MRRSKFNEEEIVAILKEGNSRLKLSEICRKYNISQGTFYRWKTNYGRLAAPELKIIKKLETRNRQLKALYKKTCKENQILQDAIAGKL